MRPLTFGIVAPQVVAWPDLVQRFRTIEEFGFDSAWVVNHFVNPYRHTGRWLEGWTALAALAGQTSRVRIGTLVTSISYRNPALLAKEALTVDHISNGRLIVGIGAAGQPQDHTMTGSGPWEAPERARRFREFVEVVDALLREEVTTYRGRYYSALDAGMTPGPVQRPRPPFTLAAHGPYTLKVAAQYADTWNTTLDLRRGERPPLTSDEGVAHTRARGELLDELAAKAGRDPATISRSLLCGGGSTPDDPWQSAGAFHDFIGRYRDAGINEFLFYYPSRAELAHGAFERIAREEIPKLRR